MHTTLLNVFSLASFTKLKIRAAPTLTLPLSSNGRNLSRLTHKESSVMARIRNIRIQAYPYHFRNIRRINTSSCSFATTGHERFSFPLFHSCCLSGNVDERNDSDERSICTDCIHIVVYIDIYIPVRRVTPFEVLPVFTLAFYCYRQHRVLCVVSILACGAVATALTVLDPTRLDRPLSWKGGTKAPPPPLGPFSASPAPVRFSLPKRPGRKSPRRR